MSEQDFQPLEQRSKIKLVRNAKGDPQWEISVLAGESDSVLDEARKQAIAQWNALNAELGIRS